MGIIRIAIVVSRFNEEITNLLLEGALQRLKELNIEEEFIKVIKVPGAVEIPLIAQRLAREGIYEAIICLGAVIRGETTHYDYVCEQVSMGCQQVALANDIPIIFGILTTENEAQAMARVGGAHGHKGRDAADAAMEMIEISRQEVETSF
ncbi:MAG: 6,7-dimethyl-8-ribityllumazine synthase [Gammaproteobacteria bacterium]